MRRHLDKVAAHFLWSGCSAAHCFSAFDCVAARNAAQMQLVADMEHGTGIAAVMKREDAFACLRMFLQMHLQCIRQGTRQTAAAGLPWQIGVRRPRDGCQLLRQIKYLERQRSEGGGGAAN